MAAFLLFLASRAVRARRLFHEPIVRSKGGVQPSAILPYVAHMRPQFVLSINRRGSSDAAAVQVASVKDAPELSGHARDVQTVLSRSSLGRPERTATLELRNMIRLGKKLRNLILKNSGKQSSVNIDVLECASKPLAVCLPND